MTITSNAPPNCSTHTTPAAVPDITDRAQFTRILLDHFRGLTAYAVAITRDESQANDVLQEASITAWKNIRKFDPTADFGRWMRGIIRNKSRESFRRWRRETPLDDEALSHLESVLDTGPDTRLFDRLNGCREKLPTDLRSAIDATYEEGRTSKEAADLLQTTPSALRKRLERARTALRQCLSH